jgi:hypothetical protein
MANSYSVNGQLVRLNEMIGAIYALYDEIPGLPKGDQTRAGLVEALDDVRALVAHAVTRGIAKPHELGKS